MDGAEVGVLKQAHQVGLSSLLQGRNSSCRPAQIGFEPVGGLPHKAREGQLADEQVSGLLVLPDLQQGLHIGGRGTGGDGNGGVSLSV
jgi:hypothetical protein